MAFDTREDFEDPTRRAIVDPSCVSIVDRNANTLARSLSRMGMTMAQAARTLYGVHCAYCGATVRGERCGNCGAPQEDEGER